MKGSHFLTISILHRKGVVNCVSTSLYHVVHTSTSIVIFVTIIYPPRQKFVLLQLCILMNIQAFACVVLMILTSLDHVEILRQVSNKSVACGLNLVTC